MLPNKAAVILLLLTCKNNQLVTLNPQIKGVDADDEKENVYMSHVA